RTREARRGEVDPPRRGEIQHERRRFLLQRQPQQPLDAANVEQLDRQGSLTRGVEAGYTVALGEPQQLLALAEPRPGEAAGQELLGEQAETCGPSSVACCTTRSGARSA